jgi:adenylate kinase
MIIFVGVAGSGKSIQGRLLSQKINAKYFSMGEFLRHHVDPSIQNKMLTGELIDDHEAIQVINEDLPKADEDGEEYILDGFPRTITQADWLIEQVKKGRFTIEGVVYLKASPETIVPRLLERKRPDDNIDAIEQRIKEYNELTLPILDHLKKANIKVHDINAELPIEEVHKEIISSLTSQ